MPHLADGREAEVEELRLAYRVPRQVMELALPLLPLIAPDVAAPIAYRDGDEPPRFVQVAADELAAAVMREAAAEAEREGRTAVIAPAELLPEVPHGDESGFDELTAPPVPGAHSRAAKGLEFDHVVLVEPAAIVEDGERIDGLRALYVALTRSTKRCRRARPRPPQPAVRNGHERGLILVMSCSVRAVHAGRSRAATRGSVPNGHVGGLTQPWPKRTREPKEIARRGDEDAEQRDERHVSPEHEPRARLVEAQGVVPVALREPRLRQHERGREENRRAPPAHERHERDQPDEELGDSTLPSAMNATTAAAE